jgi:hypothetical protein
MESFTPGMVIATRNSLDGDSRLVLVVDQAAGQKWADADPVMGYIPSLANRRHFVLVRVLGTQLSEGEPLTKSGLPDKEPRVVVTERWKYSQINHSWYVAGPDAESLKQFLEHCRLCDNLGMKDGVFIRDLALVTEYISGVTRTREDISFYEKKFFAMLWEVLPRG